MKTLSIRQPWAELIVRGEKDVENRNWPTNHRGPFIIHAPKIVDERAFVDGQSFSRSSLATSAIIGVATLVRCSRIISSDWHEDGAYGFYITRPIRLTTPIPCRGSLGFFNLEDVFTHEQTVILKQAIRDSDPEGWYRGVYAG